MALSVLEQRPDEVPSAHRARYAELVTRLCDHADVRVRRRAYQQFGAWSAGPEDRLAARAARCLATLEETPEWRDALAALLAVCQDGAATGRLLAGTDALLDLPAGENAGRERDLPRNQRVAALAEALAAWPGPARLRNAATLRDVADRLRGFPVEAAAVRFAALDFSRADETVSALSAAARNAAPVFLYGAIAERVGLAARNAPLPWEAADGQAVVERLRGSDAPLARLVALSLLGEVGRRTEWAGHAASALRALRLDADPLVRYEAERLFTARE